MRKVSLRSSSGGKKRHRCPSCKFKKCQQEKVGILMKVKVELNYFQNK